MSEVQLPLALPPRHALGERDFVRSPANAEAWAWIDRWPQWPGQVLALCGPAGSGKSHLAEIWRRRVGADLIEGPSLSDALTPLIAHGCAVIDHAALAPERPLLHLINLTRERGGALLLLDRAPPARWDTALPDLKSRLAALPLASLADPDDDLLEAVLLKLLADRWWTPGDGVAPYLRRRMERSFQAAQAAADALDHLAVERDAGLTLPLARALFPDARAPELSLNCPLTTGAPEE